MHSLMRLQTAERRGLDDLWSTPSEGSRNTEPSTFTSLEGQRITWQGDDGDEELHCNPLFETPRGLQSPESGRQSLSKASCELNSNDLTRSLSECTP